MSPAEVGQFEPASFRDPAARVLRHDGQILRYLTSIYRKIKNSFLVDSDTDRAESTISGVRRQVPCHGAGDDSPATLKSYPLRGWDEPRPEPDADTELLKAQLTLQIHTIIKQRGLTQTHAGEVLGIQQPHVSLLMRNRSGTFSVGRLMEFLAALGQDVEITVRPTRRAQGALSVVTAHPRRKGMPATP